MNVLTIYNHGTEGSSLKGPSSGEIVNLFGNNDPSPNLFDPFGKSQPQFGAIGKIITEGAASIGNPSLLKQAVSRNQSGAYAVSLTPRQQNALPDPVRNIYENASGDGVSQNVSRVMEQIRILNLAGHCPKVINMLGWSRGAVTCIRIAYQLSRSADPNLQNIQVNIFAVDPVAGPTHNKEEDATTLGSNVKHYVATLAMGERGSFFKPIAGHRLSYDSGKTAAWVLPIEGRHRDTAKSDNAAGRLTFNLAYRFLENCGTPVANMKDYVLRNEKAWKLYEKMKFGDAALKPTSFKNPITLLKRGSPYDRSRDAAGYATGDDFFANMHAKLLFKKLYPTSQQAYFNPSEARQRNSDQWHKRWDNSLSHERIGMRPGLVQALNALSPVNHLVNMEPTPDQSAMISTLRLID